MIHTLSQFSVEKRWLILVFTMMIAALGWQKAQELPLDAVPDMTNVQVQINSEADGFSPLEAEQRITFIIENAMSGIPNLNYTRSLSRYGLSQVTVVFKDGTDIYWARQQVNERLQNIRTQLPKEIDPTTGPISSGLGEIFTYAIYAKQGVVKPNGQPYNAQDLRTIQDWIIRPQLVKVPGITEINTVGGFEKQYQVTPDPAKLLAYNLSLSDVIHALENNNQTIGAGYIERHGEQFLVRSEGQLKSIEDIENVVVGKQDDAPVRIQDIASIGFGKQLRTGAATLNGQETVLGTAFMLLGENSRTVANAVNDKLLQVNHSLPDGIVAEALYDRTTLVDKTIATVQKNLFEGAVLVIVVLFLFLGNIRAAIITALVIPLSMLFAITGMAANKVSGNLMSLGAIDFGLIVDGAVIVAENAIYRLGQAQKQTQTALTLNQRLSVVIDSTKEVFQPAVVGILIIMLVYLPIFALEGVEAKMYEPMAFTVMAALAGALIFAVTFVPAAIAIFMTGKISHQENKVMHWIRKGYTPLLKFALRFPLLVLLGAILIMATSVYKAQHLGREFMPTLDEHDIALHALRIPGTGLDQAVKMQYQLEDALRELDPIKHVFAKIGTPDIATDPMPPSVADIYVILKPMDEWQNYSSKQAFLDALAETIHQVPGNNYEITQPIEMRFHELLAGVRADVAVRIYGEDLTTLTELAQQASEILASVKGNTGITIDPMQGLPMISITPDLEHLALLGLTVADLQNTVKIAIAGQQTGLIFEGDRRFKLMVRLDKSFRLSPEKMGEIPVPIANNPEMRYVPLSEIANIQVTEGPFKINRESGKRNAVLSTNVHGRDLASFVEQAKAELQQKLPLPEGYWVDFGGTYNQLQSAQSRLTLMIPLIALLIMGLLYSVFNSLRDTLIIFTAIPLALTGGIFALEFRHMPFSISAMIGFIALSGIAVLNGIVLLTVIRQLRDKGMMLMEAIQTGVSKRLRPVLMTALVASLGFIPMALNTGTGAEVQRPLATVVIGGITTSTLLTLVVLPALYYLVYRWSPSATNKS